MSAYAFSSLTTSVAILAVGLFVFLKNKNAQLNKIFFFYSLSISVWALLTACHAMTASPVVSLICARTMHIAVSLIPVFFLFFVFELLGLNKDPRIRMLLKGLFFLASLFGILSISTGLLVQGVSSKLGYANFMDPGVFYLVLIITFSVMAMLGLLFLLDAATRKDVSPIDKKKYAYLFISSLIGYGMGASNFFPVYDRTWFPYPYGSLGITFYIVVVAYVIFKYGFFSLDDLAQAAHRDKLTAIGVLAASINHEVKNPLFIIKGLAESCLERQREGIFPSKEKALESANDAMKRSMEQADRAMDIIKRLSLFAKAGIDSEIKFEPVKIAQVLEDILPLVRYELAAHGIALSRDMPPDLPEVRADRRYLEEIFFNLIVNACQAIKETGKPGEIVISATTPSLDLSRGERTSTVSSVEPDGVRGADKVIITIQDNGPGIPADKLKDVFRPFYTTKAEGTGLGLYITQQLVEKIRGRIDVRSEVGTGTTFSVLLPESQRTP